MIRLNLILLLLCSVSGFAQYRYDNVSYKTVFPQDLCRELEKNPGYVLLDVRTAGEYADTSSFGALNIGHLDGAINVDARQMGKWMRQVASFKNDPVFVYCSHSQRSRRVSKMLADSGFTNVININGGMTALLALPPLQKACIDAMLRSTNAYKVVSAPALCRKLSEKYQKDVFLLDVRPDSVWNKTALNPRFNAYGHLNGSKHITLADLPAKIDALPKGKEIVIVDINGTDAAAAARLLTGKGFAKVTVLLEGLDRWLAMDKSGWGCKDSYVSGAPFTLLNSFAFANMYKANPGLVLLDLRSTEEFENKHKDAFRNVGYLQGAINLPAAEMETGLEKIEKYKDVPVVIYANSGIADVYAAAFGLSQKGFSKVYVLTGGLYNLRWTAANEPGMAFLNDWMKDVPEANR